MSNGAAAAASGVKKDHHFVPQLYLRAFVDPASKQGELWRYGPGFERQPKAPKGVAWQDYFYDVAGELPPEDNDIEEFFGQVETIAAPHLQKLRDGNINLTPQEKSELASFIGLLKTRRRAYRESVNIIASKMHVLAAKETLETPGGVEDLVKKNVAIGGEETDPEKVRQTLQAVVDGNVIVEQTSKAWTIKQALERSEDLAELIESMNWNLLQAPDGDQFITSDNPVVITDPIGRIHGPKGYRPSVLTQLQFPVSPKYMLVGDFMGPNQTVQKISSELLPKFQYNQLVSAHKEVYAPFESDDLQAAVDKTFNEKPPLVPELPPDRLKK